jgi:hypothetical protein
MAILKNKNKNPLSNGHQMAKFGGERGIIITLWGGVLYTQAFYWENVIS